MKKQLIAFVVLSFIGFFGTNAFPEKRYPLYDTKGKLVGFKTIKEVQGLVSKDSPEYKKLEKLMKKEKEIQARKERAQTTYQSVRREIEAGARKIKEGLKEGARTVRETYRELKEKIIGQPKEKTERQRKL